MRIMAKLTPQAKVTISECSMPVVRFENHSLVINYNCDYDLRQRLSKNFRLLLLVVVKMKLERIA